MNTSNRKPCPREAEAIRPGLWSWIILFLGCLLVPGVFLLTRMPV
ncbi:MAG TPA: hypothetical protein PLF04_07920 [Candidatus Fermentibacter daniensis]|nr:hypothetical protein [Candidatus Fermentibacter daniensis]HOZ18248.1 hypothetical protein [Candidatus Fermentibacter daniensis]